MANAYGAQFTVGDYVSIGAMKGRSPERVGQIAKVLGSKDKGDKIAYRLGLADEVFWTSGTGLTDAPAQQTRQSRLAPWSSSAASSEMRRTITVRGLLRSARMVMRRCKSPRTI
jgi:hypothetical protein